MIPQPPYSDEQLAIFAKHVDKRAEQQPAACDRGEGCWVLLGPPGYEMGTGGYCRRCRGAPVLVNPGRPGPWPRTKTRNP